MPGVHRDIFKKNFASTPEARTTAILALCAEVSAGHQPMLVEVMPEPDAQVSECFHNVEKKVARSGGDILYGWAIWEWPRVFVEAEHHAVWRNGDLLLDVTPHANGERSIMFLPDPARTYDFEHQKREINVKRSLGEFLGAQRWIDGADYFQRLIEESSNGAVVTLDPARVREVVDYIENEKAHLILALAKGRRVNERCICRSGLKYKKCCAPLIQFG